jgi:hypothetical protein
VFFVPIEPRGGSRFHIRVSISITVLPPTLGLAPFLHIITAEVFTFPLPSHTYSKLFFPQRSGSTDK